MTERFLTCEVADIRIGEPLPCAVYLYLDFRFITFRGKEDVIDRLAMDRFLAKRIRQIFVRHDDLAAWTAWVAATPRPPEPQTAEEREIRKVREDMRRAANDIFSAAPIRETVAKVLAASRQLVDQVMKAPYAIKPVLQLQGFSQGTVDHSVNVSILSTYLAMQMGYSHSVILQNIAAGALLHDIGKAKVPLGDADDDAQVAAKMLAHPEIGFAMLEEEGLAPNEIKWIVAQHHECSDGTGYPKRLRGNSIYDLTRIVSIANAFDERVGEGRGPLLARQKSAIAELEGAMGTRFDPVKLEKAIKILKLGL